MSSGNSEGGDVTRVNMAIIASVIAALKMKQEPISNAVPIGNVPIGNVPIGNVPIGNAPDINLDNILAHMPYLGFINFEDRLYELLKSSLTDRIGTLVQTATTIMGEKKSIMDGANTNLIEATKIKENAELEKTKADDEINRIKSEYDTTGPGGKGLLTEQYDNAKKKGKLTQKDMLDSTNAYNNAVDAQKIATNIHNNIINTHFQAEYKLNEIQGFVNKTDFYKTDFQFWLLGADTTEKQVYANMSTIDKMKNRQTSYTNTYSKYFTAYAERKQKYNGAARVETIETSRFEEFAFIDHHDEYDRAIMGKQSGGGKARAKIITNITNKIVDATKPGVTTALNATKQGATTALNATKQGATTALNATKQFSNQPITTTRNTIPNIGRRISDIREADSKGAVYYSGKTDIREVIRLDNFNFTRYCNGYVWFLAAWIYSPELGYFHLKDLDIYNENKVNPRFFWNFTNEIKQKDGSSIKTFRYFNKSNVLIGDKKEPQIQLYETDVTTKQKSVPVSLLHNEYLEQILPKTDSNTPLISDINHNYTVLSPKSFDLTFSDGNSLFDWNIQNSIYYPEKYKFDTKITPDLGVPYFMMGCLTPDKNVIFYPHLERGQYLFFMSKDDYMKEMDYMNKDGDNARQKAEEDARRKAEEEAEEARQKAEEEARRKADEEARQKAEEEARRKADEDAAEARRIAEEEAAEARRIAEEDAARQREEDKKTAAIVAAIENQKQEDARKRDEEDRNKIAVIIAVDEKRKQEDARKRDEEERNKIAVIIAVDEKRKQEDARKRDEEERNKIAAIIAVDEKRKQEEAEQLDAARKRNEQEEAERQRAELDREETERRRREQEEAERNKIAAIVAAIEKRKQEEAEQLEAERKRKEQEETERNKIAAIVAAIEKRKQEEAEQLEAERLREEEEARKKTVLLVAILAKKEAERQRAEQERLNQEETERRRREQEEETRNILAAILAAISQTPVVSKKLQTIFDFITVLFVEKSTNVTSIISDVEKALKYHLYYERLNQYMTSLVTNTDNTANILSDFDFFEKLRKNTMYKKDGTALTNNFTNNDNTSEYLNNSITNYNAILNENNPRMNPGKLKVNTLASNYANNIFDYQQTIVNDIEYFSIPISYMASISDKQINSIADDIKEQIEELVRKCKRIDVFLNNLKTHEEKILSDIVKVRKTITEQTDKNNKKTLVDEFGKKLTTRDSDSKYLVTRSNDLYNIYNNYPGLENDKNIINEEPLKNENLSTNKDTDKARIAKNKEDNKFIKYNAIKKFVLLKNYNDVTLYDNGERLKEKPWHENWYVYLFANMETDFIVPIRALLTSINIYQNKNVNVSNFKQIILNNAGDTEMTTVITSINGLSRGDEKFVTKYLDLLNQLKQIVTKKLYNAVKPYVVITDTDNITTLDTALQEIDTTTKRVKTYVSQHTPIGTDVDVGDINKTPNVFLHTELDENKKNINQELKSLGYTISNNINDYDYSSYLQHMYEQSIGKPQSEQALKYHYMFLVPHISDYIKKKYSLTIAEISKQFKSFEPEPIETVNTEPIETANTDEFNLGGSDYFKDVGSIINNDNLYDLNSIFEKVKETQDVEVIEKPDDDIQPEVTNINTINPIAAIGVNSQNIPTGRNRPPPLINH